MPAPMCRVLSSTLRRLAQYSPLECRLYQLTFTPTDTTDYTIANARVQLTVNKAAPAITWPTPSPITYGTPLSSVQLDASANVPGTFVYTPSFGTVLMAGPQTLSVTFTPNDSTDYTTATSSVPLLVNKALPTITWPTPAPIPYGTRSEFNATRCHCECSGNPRLHTASRNRSSAWQSDAIREHSLQEIRRITLQPPHR